jgi:hypothetical protein
LDARSRISSAAAISAVTGADVKFAMWTPRWRAVTVRAAVAENQPKQKNRMTSKRDALAKLATQIKSFINECATTPAAPDSDDAWRLEMQCDELALNLFSEQLEKNRALAAWCERTNSLPNFLRSWQQVPPIPISAFKLTELTALPKARRTTVFQSSGTTGQGSSRHFHSKESLELYEASLMAWFRPHLLPEIARTPRAIAPDDMRILVLTPQPEAEPHSSLVHMFGTIVRELAALNCFVGVADAAGGWSVDGAAAARELDSAVRGKNRVMILGTAFSFVHLLDFLRAEKLRFKLAAGSRVLETGGYKGRSRELPKAELHAEITRALGVPDSHIVCEYGMSELGSQAYDRVAGNASRSPRCFHFPPWARFEIVSPENRAPVREGETGMIRVCDLANVWSVMAVQTEDLGTRRGEGFELVGRASASEQRGCSLMSE